ncbi:MAG TPA: tripartite tricarboxylate transporter substrate binding protein [Pseudolabrys sp.]|nr:tripartite tricarboxylate transporter substrate binding protein [Pseudolabrys sp.]
MTRRFKCQPGKLLASAAVVSMAFAACGASRAADYPKHDITFIVPYSPGGGSDIQARRLQPGLQKALGVNIRIVYKTGGGGAVGFLALHSSKPDGYTIANVVVPNIIVTSKGKDVGFKPANFSYIAMTETAPGALVVAKNSKFKTLKDFVKYAKAHPGKLTVAGTGPAGKAAVAEIINALGVKVTYVPVSKGVGQIVPYLEGNHVDAAEFASSHVLEHSDVLRALGIAGKEPSPALKDVPTFDSLGYHGFTAATTWGVMAPPGTPKNIVTKLNSAVEKAVSAQNVQAALTKHGLTPMKQTPAQAKQFVLDNVAAVDRDEKLMAKMGK